MKKYVKILILAAFIFGACAITTAWTNNSAPVMVNASSGEPIPDTYQYTILPDSPSGFVATNKSGNFTHSNPTMQPVINAIRTHADLNDVIITFGNGEDWLDNGAVPVTFYGINSEINWGNINIRGKLTVSNPVVGWAVIVRHGHTVISEADIRITDNADTARVAIQASEASTITVSGGSITASQEGRAIAISDADSTVNINGGVVSAEQNFAVTTSGGVLNINGGTISSGGTIAISSSTAGEVVLNGTPTIVGSIRIGGGRLSTLSTFSPQTNKFTIEVSGGALAEDDIVVTGGANFRTSFQLIPTQAADWHIVACSAGINLVLSETPPDDDDDDDDNGKGNNNDDDGDFPWMWVGIGAGGGVALIGLAVALTLLIKRRK